MPSIKAGSGEVIIEVGCSKARQPIKVVLGPFPHITIYVMETQAVWRVHVHWLKCRMEKKMDISLYTTRPLHLHTSTQHSLELYHIISLSDYLFLSLPTYLSMYAYMYLSIYVCVCVCVCDTGRIQRQLLCSKLKGKLRPKDLDG